MKNANRVSLAVGLVIAGSPGAVGGDHFGWRTTTTVPVAPAVFGVVQQAPTLAVAPAAFTFALPAATPTYVYYQASVVPTAPMAAPSLMNLTAPAFAAPQAAGAWNLPSLPLANGAAGAVKARILQGLRDFAARNHVDRGTMVAALRQVGLGLLRAELNQWGLGFLVPGQDDLNVLEGLVQQVVQERFGGDGGNGGGGTVAAGTAPPSFVFQGPVTLSFPNVQTVQIQTRDVQKPGAGVPSIPALADPNPSSATETPVPSAPTVPPAE